MMNNKKSYSIALVSTAMILVLISIAGATPFAYITNTDSRTVSVIDTANNTVTATVPVETTPYGVAVTPDGTKVYVTNRYDSPGDVSVINTTNNTAYASINCRTLS